MSKELDGLIGKSNDADDALLDGMKRIASHVVKRDEKNDSRFGEVEEKVSTGLEALDNKIEKGLSLVAEKLERFAQRSSALNVLSSGDPQSELLQALTPEEKTFIPIYEMHIANGGVESGSDLSRDPVFRTAKGLFFVNALNSHERLKGRSVLARVEKLHRAFDEAYGGVTKAAFDTTDADVGGNTVPTAIENELRRLITDNSILRPLVTKIPMTQKTVELPKEGSSAMTVSVGTGAVAEGATIPDSIPASAVTAVVSMAAEPYKGRAVSSVEAIQDSAISIMEWVQAKLTEEMGRAEDTQALEGTGSPHTGLLGDADVNEIAAGTNGDVVTYAFLVADVFNAGERATRRGARWFVSPTLMAAIIGLVDTQGMPVVQYGNVPNSIAPTLLGFPVEVHSGIDATRTKGIGVGLSHLYFGNPAGLVFGDRTGMTWSVSDAPGFDNDEVHMKLTKRTGIVVGVPSAFTRHLDYDAP